MLFIEYPKCSTCQKAKNYLINNHIDFIDRDIKLNTPTIDELKEFIIKSGLDIKKFFNTSGLVYKDLNLKEKLLNLSFEEQLTLLSSNGMLIKRPLLITDNKVLVGFKEKEWDNLLK